MPSEFDPGDIVGLKKENYTLRRGEEKKEEVKKESYYNRYYRDKDEPTLVGYLAIIFFIIALFVWAFLILVSPSWLSYGTGTFDKGKAFALAFIIALLITIAIFLIYGYTRKT